MKVKRIICIVVIFSLCLLSAILNIYSESSSDEYLKALGNHSDTYDITNAIYNTGVEWGCSLTPMFYVDVIPTYFEGGDTDIDMTIHLEKKLIFWKRVEYDNVNLVSGGSVKLKGDGRGKYRLLFENNSDFQAKGNIEISYITE